MSPVSRGFRRRRTLDPEVARRLPPGQHIVDDLPVLTVGPTPRGAREHWTLRLAGAIDVPRMWAWDEFSALPSERFTTDIHCVTSWSMLDTVWKGVSLDTLLDGVQTPGRYLLATCDGG